MRAVIAEDLTLLRDGLAAILRAHDIEVAAAVGDPVALAQALEEEQPDVAIVDGPDAAYLHQRGPEGGYRGARPAPRLPVLVLSQYVEQLYARELLLAAPTASATC